MPVCVGVDDDEGVCVCVCVCVYILRVFESNKSVKLKQVVSIAVTEK